MIKTEAPPVAKLTRNEGLKTANAQYIRKIRAGIIRVVGLRCNVKGDDRMSHSRWTDFIGTPLDGCEKRDLDYCI